MGQSARLLHVGPFLCQPCTCVLQGLDVGQCALLLHVRPCEGLVRQVDGSIEKRFSPKHLLYPIQVSSDAQYLSCQHDPHPCLQESVADSSSHLLA